MKKKKKTSVTCRNRFSSLFKGILALIYSPLVLLTLQYTVYTVLSKLTYDSQTNLPTESYKANEPTTTTKKKQNIRPQVHSHPRIVVKIHFSSSNVWLMVAYCVHFRLIISSWINILLQNFSPLFVANFFFLFLFLFDISRRMLLERIC